VLIISNADMDHKYNAHLSIQRISQFLPMHTALVTFNKVFCHNNYL